MTWVFAAIAGIAAVTCEIYYRAHVGTPWLQLLWVGLPLALLVNFGIWGLLQRDTLIGATILFTLMTSTVRLVWTLLFGGVVAAGSWAGFALVVLAAVIKTLWK